MSDCPRTREELAAGAPASAEREAHLAACPKCARFERDVAQLRRLAGQLPRPPVPPPRPGRSWTSSWRPALAGALAIAAVLVASWRLTTPAGRDTRIAAEERVDLLGALAAAEQVWSVPPAECDAPSDAPALDPLASLRPVELLLEARNDFDDQGGDHE